MKNITKYILALLLVNCSLLIEVNAQVAINENNSEPDVSAMLDVSSTDKGLLVPRMSEAERDLIQNPAQGLMIFNTTDSCFNYYTGMEWYKDCGRDLTTDKATLSPITFNATDTDDAEDIAFDSQGNILITGQFRTAIEIGDTTLTALGASDIYLSKYDAAQNVLWTRQIGSSSSIFDPHITTDKDDNVYVMVECIGSISFGSTTLSPQGSRDVFLAKYNSGGTLQWLIQTDFSIEGSTNGDVVADEQGDVYVSGSFEGTATFGANALSNSSNQQEAFLLKCSSNGVWQWGVQTSNSSSSTTSYDVAIQADTLYWAGEFNNDTTIGSDSYLTGTSQGFVAKFDTDGNYVSSMAIGGGDYLEAYAIAVDDSGNYYVGGNLFGDFVFGDTSVSVRGSEGFFLVKYNANDQAEWVSTQDDDDAFIYDIALDNNNDPIAVGEFEGTFTFDTLSISTGSTGDSEIFILKYDKNGIFQWVETGTSNDGSPDDGNGVGVDQNNIIYALGDYINTVNFSDISLTSTGDSDALILRLQSEDGAQLLIDNSLANSQDGDTDATNELQDLSFDGTTLEISSANSVDLSSLMTNDTDNQTIDKLNLNGTTLELSLEDDGEGDQSVDLASLDTDNQTIDKLNLNGTTFEISLEDDGEGDQSVDLASLDTDNQTIDKLNLNGTTLELSLEDDGEGDQSVDLASLDTDNQTIDKLNLNGTTLELSLEDDGEGDQSVDLASLDTDNQTIDKLNLNGTTLEISLEGDGEGDQSVDLASLDDQTLSLNNATLSISGGNSVDLTNLVPIGTIQMWATSTPPTGWLICDGSTFSASTYSDLNSVLGGNTLPDFTGRFPLGAGNSGTSGSTNHNLSSTGGEETHTLTIDEMPSHSHGINYTGRNKSGSGGEVSDLESSGSTTPTTSTGGGQAHNNMPPFYTINFIIKAE